MIAHTFTQLSIVQLIVGKMVSFRFDYCIAWNLNQVQRSRMVVISAKALQLKMHGRYFYSDKLRSINQQSIKKNLPTKKNNTLKKKFITLIRNYIDKFQSIGLANILLGPLAGAINVWKNSLFFDFQCLTWLWLLIDKWSWGIATLKLCCYLFITISSNQGAIQSTFLKIQKK